MMTADELIAISPFIVITSAAVLAMLLIAIYRCHSVVYTVALIGMGLSFTFLLILHPQPATQVTSLLIVDRYAVFFMALFLSAGLIICVFSYEYFRRRAGNNEEYYLLFMLAVLGSMVIVSSSHFVSFFLGLELLSISLYAMIAYLRNSESAIEAGIKYLVLASISVAFMLFGIALIYADTGLMTFADISTYADSSVGALTLLGTVLFIVGVGFKLAVVPFHMWTPDVYEGSSAPVAAFIATISKGAVFVFLFRYFNRTGMLELNSIFAIFMIISTASMFVGNLLALLQNNVKRILAYSSIAHMGYLLVAFLSGGRHGIAAVCFYLVAYFVTTLGAFGVVGLLSRGEREADMIADYRGMAWRKPWLAALFTFTLLSLAGIPLTAGFIGKFYLLTAGASSALWFLVIMLITSSAIGLFYYLRIVIAMYRQPAEEVSAISTIRAFSSGGLTLTGLTFILISLGVYPSVLISIIHFFVGDFY
jgi:NADH-quinone oxidoreductase subunit N